MSELQIQIESLSPAEKSELLDVLWESLEREPAALTAEQSSELDARVERYRRNPTNVLPWEGIRAGLFRKQ